MAVFLCGPIRDDDSTMTLQLRPITHTVHFNGVIQRKNALNINKNHLKFTFLTLLKTHFTCISLFDSSTVEAKTKTFQGAAVSEVTDQKEKRKIHIKQRINDNTLTMDMTEEHYCVRWKGKIKKM